MLGRLKFEIDDLVDDMLDRLPNHIWSTDGLRFIDHEMGGGQFIQGVVKRLRSNGFSDENIKSRVFGFSQNELYLSYVNGKSEIIGTFDIYDKEKISNMKKFDVVLGNPPYQIDTGGVTNKTIWHKFVETSFEICKKDGYVSLIHPPNWRDVGGKFIKIKELMFSKNIKYINMNDVNDGNRIFKVSQPFDWYVIQNNSDKSDIKINDIYNEESIINIDDFEFIPNGSVDLIKSLLAKDDESTVEVLYDRSLYGTDKDNTNKEKTNKYKYPCVRYVYQDGTIDCHYSTENNGHFGIPKVMMGKNADTGEVIIDSDGKYGMTEYMFAIVDKPENLPKIKKALESDKFHKLMDDCRFSRMMFNRRVISLFRKDFWKEFI